MVGWVFWLVILFLWVFMVGWLVGFFLLKSYSDGSSGSLWSCLICCLSAAYSR